MPAEYLSCNDYLRIEFRHSIVDFHPSFLVLLLSIHRDEKMTSKLKSPSGITYMMTATEHSDTQTKTPECLSSQPRELGSKRIVRPSCVDVSEVPAEKIHGISLMAEHNATL